MVKDTAFYDILGVSPEASSTDIKKAYRKMAMLTHPDKHPDDPEAQAKFQAVGEAYQILSDPTTRSHYDEFGMDAEQPHMEDPSAYFSAIFGGEGFNNWVGEFSMMEELSKGADIFSDQQGEANPEAGDDMVKHDGKAAQAATANPGKLTKEQREEFMKMEQERRLKKKAQVAELAAKLEDRLSDFYDADRSGFDLKLNREIEELKLESFGIELLHLMGKIYKNKAQAFINAQKTFGFSKLYSGVKNKTDSAKSAWNVLSSALDAQTALKDAERLEEVADEYERAELERLITGKVLGTAWKMTKFEAQSTLKNVCDKILDDKTVGSKVRVKKAQAMLYLADKFSAAKRTPEEQAEAQVFEELIFEASKKK